MSSLSQFISGGGKLRYQEFVSSGTFTPSAALLAAGGQCFVTLIGGGGAGGGAPSNSTSGAGGDAGQYIAAVVTVSGAVTVTLGAGGVGAANAIGTRANSGGSSAFGGLLAASGGLGGATRAESDRTFLSPGAGAAGYGSPALPDVRELRGGIGINGKAGGGGCSITDLKISGDGRDGAGSGAYSDAGGGSATANSGGGGGGARRVSTGSNVGGSGGSGWCRVVWFE